MKETKYEEWTKEIELFCEVVRHVSSHVVVITSYASCFPAFLDFEEAYDKNVEHLRGVLTRFGVQLCYGA